MGLPRRAQFVIVVTAALGGLGAWLVCADFERYGIGSIWLLCVFTLFVVASWLWPILMYQGSSSEAHNLDDGLFVLIVLAMRPVGVLMAFGVATVLSQALRRRPPVKSIFNLAQILLSVSVGIGVVHLIDPPTSHLSLGQIGAGIIGAIVYFVVNSVAVTSILSAIGAIQTRSILLDGLEIRILLLGASISIGLVSAMAVVAYPFAAVFTGLPFWAFRQTLAGHYRARHDRTRLRGLFDATLEVNRTMGEDEVTTALTNAARASLGHRT